MLKSIVGQNVYHLFSYLGSALVLLFIFQLLHAVVRAFMHHIIRKLQLNVVAWAELGKWALITGGSDGIGKAYAEELARKGFNIILISRTIEKLESVAMELSEKYSVETKTISVDFTGNPDIYEHIRKEISNYDIGVLVNNIGMSYDHTEYFHAIPGGLKTIEKLVRSNMVSCTMMTRLILPQMESRGKGVIINISSLTALYPMPLLNVYAASKAYVDYLSRALHVEYKGKGVIIQSVLPGYVATKMSNRRISLEIPSAECFVNSAIKTVGLETYTFGYSVHKMRGALHEWLRSHMPTCVNMSIAMYYMKKSRDRYFRKHKNIEK